MLPSCSFSGWYIVSCRSSKRALSLIKIRNMWWSWRYLMLGECWPWRLTGRKSLSLWEGFQQNYQDCLKIIDWYIPYCNVIFIKSIELFCEGKLFGVNKNVLIIFMITITNNQECQGHQIVNRHRSLSLSGVKTSYIFTSREKHSPFELLRIFCQKKR